MPTETPTPSRDIARLLEVMAALRTPVTGCPWDLDQTLATVAPYAVEEAYEVADAVERADMVDLREELGDLLLQVVFQSRLAEEAGAFDFGGVVDAITTKLIRRHPHVFGEARSLSPTAVKTLWDSIKAEEKAERAARHPPAPVAPSILAEVPGTFPPLLRARKLQSKAATVGFDWSDTADVIGKVREELGEVEDAVRAGDGPSIQDEIGDLLFAVVNLARHRGIDPEVALRATNGKFERRFAAVEEGLRQRGRPLGEATLSEMDALWDAAKTTERAA